MLERGELTGMIIGAAIAVHTELGPGFLESVYGEALAVELRRRGVSFQREFAVPILYRGIEVGMHRLDLFVEERIVVELKSIKEIVDFHFVVARSYLKSVRCKHGLILNFAKPSLEVRRVRTLTIPS